MKFVFPAALLLTAALAVAEDKPPRKVELKELPPVKSDNKNTLITNYKAKLEVTASTTYPGWPATNAVDGVETTSWFSATGDAAAKKTKPWLEVKFPEDVTVSRVTILGNRDPAWHPGRGTGGRSPYATVSELDE